MAVRTPSPTKEVLLAAYRTMRTIRTFEERLHEEVPRGEIPGAVHLYTGQEAVAAGVCAHLRPEDHIASTHRGHGHALAKGCDPTAMMLEIYGKQGGLCDGKGGSMHIADFDLGMLGANGIAGGGAPLVCGAGLTAKMRGTDDVAVAFVGDGGANQGAFTESLNLAAVWELPVVFVVENNGYAQATGTRYHLRGLDVSERAAGYGIPGVTAAGDDFTTVYEAAGEAIARARSGEGPTLLEFRTPRLRGHMEGYDKETYRGDGEVDELWANHDCLQRLSDQLTVAGLATDGDLAELDAEAQEAIDRAVTAARTAPQPPRTQLTTDVYASYADNASHSSH
ncbi:thiamine pyrophosphate-dependent dehydrogenase E1 component subunit alpha [Streptomyces sp. NPDC002851]